MLSIYTSSLPINWLISYLIVKYGLRNKAGNDKLDVKRMRIILLMFLLSDRNYESVRNIDKTNALSLIFQECVLVKIND